MFGYSKEEMIGLYVRNFMTNEAPYRWEDAQCFYDKAAAGEPQLFEWLAVDKAGRTFWVEANVKRAVIGNKYRIISMLRDITERKRLDSMKDNFVNSVSHELRTPLAAIKEGVAIVLEEIKGKVGKENRNILGIVKKNVDRLNRLITDVLDFQKIESGLMVFRPKQHNMNDIVMECVRTMMPLAYENKLELLTDLTKKIPKIAFDKDRVLQVLMNIVSNAMKFTKKGSIKIFTKVEGNTVKVSISDTGMGIKPEDMPKVFSRFWRGNYAPGTRTPGTGLGLAISKEIIEKQMGKIWVESKWGEGTTVHFVLPIKERRG
jgi:PAS domain S-box-containing protein